MPKEEWGVKRICPTSGKRFFDMNKKPIISPYTGETVVLDANTRTRVAAPEKTEEKAKDDKDEAEDILLDDSDDGETAVDNDLLDDDVDNDDIPLEEIKDVPAGDDN